MNLADERLEHLAGKLKLPDVPGLVPSLAQEAAILITTRVGGTRIMDFPRGLLLPRIC